jgi:hypothetical protein
VQRVAADRLVTDSGDVPSRSGEVYVDCTARGVPYTTPTAVFTPDRITLAYTTLGITPWGAATVAAVEAMRDSDEEKNRLCPALHWNGRTADLLALAQVGMAGLTARSGEADISAWNEGCRLNPASGAIAKAGSDPSIGGSLTTIISNIGPAFENMQRRLAGAER